MVDNEPLEARKADDIEKDTSRIPLTCSSSSCSTVTQGQTARLSVTDVRDDGQCDAAVDNEDDRLAAAPSADASDTLRQIVIDGSNIAMSHGNRTMFSCRGIKLAVDWFRQRGHRNITVFVPQWRRESHKQECTVSDPQIMSELEQEKILVFTPSRKIRGKRIVCHDDRYIVRLAAETDGVIVSNDNYRDLVAESQDFRKAIEERLLMYSFVNDRFMPPDDPLGRHGPSLDDFLRKEPVVTEPRPLNCPYAKCTFGAKCRFYHPERLGSHHRPSVSPGTGDRLNASATDSRDPSGNSVASYRKKKLSSSRRSYEKQNPENKHLNVKPFKSDPTNSSSCGHLDLAKKLSHEYKSKAMHIPDSSAIDKGLSNNECTEDRTDMRDAAAAYKPEKLHQQVRRQLAIQGNNDPRAAGLSKTYNVNYSAEHDCRDAWNKPSVNLSASATASEVRTCSSSTDTASQLDSERSSSSTSHVNRIKPDLPQLSRSSDPPHFVTTRRSSSQDHASGARFRPTSPLLAANTACMDNMYFVRPLVFSTDLHSYRQFPAPQLMPRIHMSPSWPQMFAYQSRSCLPQNEHLRPVVSTHRFLHR